MKFDDIKRVLSKCELFSGVKEEELEDLARRVVVSELLESQRIFVEDDEGDEMIVVASGVVRIHRGAKALRMLGPGAVFGEMALLQPGSRRAASATSEGPVTLLKFGRETFSKLVQARPEVLLAMVREFSQRVNAYIYDIARVRHVLEEVILPLGVALSSESVETLLLRIVGEAQKLTGADGATLYLRRGDNLGFEIMLCESLGIRKGTGFAQPVALPALPLKDASGDPNLTNIATFVANMGYSVNLPDVYETSGFDFSGARRFDQANAFRTRSCLTTPLRDHERNVIGVVQLINARDSKGHVVEFTSYHELVVDSLSSQAAMAINTQSLLEKQKQLAKLEHELHVATQIQADFLPDSMPELDGYEIDSRFRPAREVGGDFFDAFRVRDRVGFVIADVCDKGVGAALFMALSRSLVRAFSCLDVGSATALAASDPIRLTNNYIASFHQKMNMFVTVFYGLLDPQTGVLQYINAGHNPPLIVGANGNVKSRLTLTGPAVGLIEDVEFRTGEAMLDPGDVLFAYTDGVTEARNASGAFFGEQRLVETLSSTHGASAGQIVRAVDRALAAHVLQAEPSDDITMLVVRRSV